MAGSAGVVLAGGRSSRMGTPKSGLEWHGSTLLRRTVGIVSRATGGPVVVVRASGQDLPPLPAGTVVVDDPREGRGPVQGIAAGLAALAGRAEIAFVASTDLPFLHPAFIDCVLRALTAEGGEGGEGGEGREGGEGGEGTAVALPVARGHRQPLAAAYRVSIAATAERLVAEGRLRPAFLFDECAVISLDEALLRQDPVLAALDPELDSLLNVNSPVDYQAARSLPAPPVTVRVCGALASQAGGRPAGPLTIRAATVRGAAEGLGLAFGHRLAFGWPGAWLAELNGGEVTTDGETPLVTGDNVYFLSPAVTGVR